MRSIKSTIRTLFLVSILTFITNTFLLAQPYSGKIYHKYNPNIAIWEWIGEESWHYDEQGREILHIRESQNGKIVNETNFNGSKIQSEIIRQNFTLLNIEEQTIYHYDQNSNLITKTYFYYNDKSATSINELYEYSYDSGNNSITEDYFLEEELTATKIDFYDDANCLIRSETSNYVDGIIDNSNFTINTYQDNCEITSEAYYLWYPEQDSSYLRTETIYSSTDSTTTEAFMAYDEIGEIEYLFKTVSNDFDQPILIINLYNKSRLDSVVYIYDSFNELIRIELFSRSTNEEPLELISESLFLYERNEANLITRKEAIINLQQDPIRTFKHTTHYTYDCGNRLSTEITEDITDVDIQRVTYIYPEQLPCQDKRKEFHVFPNPTKEICFIKSDLLFENGTTLKVFDSSGKLVFEDHLNNDLRINYNLDVSSWAKGFYIISLKNKKEIVTSSFIKI